MRALVWALDCSEFSGIRVTHTHVHTHTYTRTFEHIHMHSNVRVYVCVCMRVCVTERPIHDGRVQKTL